MIRNIKWEQLRARLSELGVRESDLDEKFVKGSGRGGQKMNKTASCVHLTHKESGVTIKCQKTRSREDNRFFARRLLCERLEESSDEIISEQEKERAKKRKQKKRRLRRRSAD